MKRIEKAEVIKLMTDLKKKYSNEELGDLIGKSAQTIWCFSSPKLSQRIPSKMDFKALKDLLNKSK